MWPKPLYFAPDDFVLLEQVTSILDPVRVSTHVLSQTVSTVGDFVQIFTSTLDAVIRMEIPSNTNCLKDYVLSALTNHLKMLLGTENQLPCFVGAQFTNFMPSEFVLASILNPRFCSAIESVYGYSKRLIVTELDRLYATHFADDVLDTYSTSPSCTYSSET